MSDFNAALVTIQRHRSSTTQGEVSVSYEGRLLGRYGDNIQLVGKGWVGIADAEWVETARKFLDLEAALTYQAPAAARRVLPVKAEVTFTEAGDQYARVIALGSLGSFWTQCRMGLTGIASRGEKPDAEGYAKTDVRITFEDGHHYDARLDLKHPSRRDNDCDLSAHILHHVATYSGQTRPPHIDAKRFLHLLNASGGPERVRGYVDFRATYALTDAECEEAKKVDEPVI